MSASSRPPRRPRPVPGWSNFEQILAWFKAWLQAHTSGDARLLDLASRELRARASTWRRHGARGRREVLRLRKPIGPRAPLLARRGPRIASQNVLELVARSPTDRPAGGGVVPPAAMENVMKKKVKCKAADTKPKLSPATRNPRLPAVGAVIERVFKGATYTVEVTAEGFSYDGKPWRSLTAVAANITGYKSVSGPAFFGLTKPTPKPKPLPAPPAPPAPPTATKRKAGRPIAPRRTKGA